MPIYLFAAVVLSRREELLQVEKEDEDILYVMLSKLPQPFDVEFHIARTVELYERLPPAKLDSWEWWHISSFSVLKASATNASLRKLTLEDGEALLEKQEMELRRQKALQRFANHARVLRTQVWRYRRSGTLGLAILVGLYAFWLGKNGASHTAGWPLLGSLLNYLKR